VCAGYVSPLRFEGGISGKGPMKPGLCRGCREIHDPLISCSVARRLAVTAVVTPVVTPSDDVVTPKTVVTGKSRFKAWYEAHKEAYRDSQRYVMQVRRAVKSGRACPWPT
jgi:hypothetical protein